MFSQAIRAFRTGATILALFGFAAVAHAQSAPSAAHIKLATEVVDASGGSRSFDRVIPQLFQQTYSTYLAQNPDLTKDLTESLAALIPEFEKRKEEILVFLARAFADKFSEAELKELLAFYRSPTGKKLVEQQSAILQDAFQKTQEWGAKVSQELIDRLKAEMKKRGHTI